MADKVAILVLTTAALAVRLYNIAVPAFVVSDEAQYASIITSFVSGSFFLDLQPPLGKQMYSSVAQLFAYNGTNRPGAVGTPYPPEYPFEQLRTISAVLGSLMVPLGFFALRSLGFSKISSTIGGSLIAFDNGLITESRFILMDSQLLFFTALSFSASSQLDAIERQRKSFGWMWWFWTVVTSVGITGAIGIKWTGFFCLFIMILLTAKRFWDLLSDSAVSMRMVISSTIVRLIFFTVIPIVILLGSFHLQFDVMRKAGGGDHLLSSRFQASLEGSNFVPTNRDVGMFSRVSLLSETVPAGYLHSHPHGYPGGSKQQQVTIYNHRDLNNFFIINPSYKVKGEGLEKGKKGENETESSSDTASDPAAKKNENEERDSASAAGDHDEVNQNLADTPPPQNQVVVAEADDTNQPTGLKPGDPFLPLRNFTRIRLRHELTERHLHSHPVRAPLTKGDHFNEVSCYGGKNFSGDSNDNWIVIIVPQDVQSGAEPTIRTVKAYEQILQFKHVNSGCLLSTREKKLPPWGFHQIEVLCVLPWAYKDVTNTYWRIAINENDALPEDAPKSSYPPISFQEKLSDYLTAVKKTSDHTIGDRHAAESRPEDWLRLRGILMIWVPESVQKNKENSVSGEVNEETTSSTSGRIFLAPNPFVWILGILGNVCIVVLIALTLLSIQRGIVEIKSDFVNVQYYGLFPLGVWWFMHFAPYIMIEHSLFIYNFLFSHFFASLLFAALLDLLVLRRLNSYTSFLLASTIIAITISVYMALAPVTYGWKMGEEDCARFKSTLGWNLCN